MLEKINRFFCVEKGVSRLSWWMVALLLLPLVRMEIFTRRRAEGDYSAIDAFALFEIIIIGITLLFLMKNSRNINLSLLRKSGLIWIVSYYFYSIFSFLWRLPGTSMPYVVYRAGSMVVISLYSFYFLSCFTKRENAFKGLVNYVLIILFIGIIRSFRIGNFHTNAYSVTAGVLLCLSLSAVRMGLCTRNELKWHIVLGALCLVSGTSSASNVAFACAMIFILSSGKKGMNVFLFIILSIVAYYVYKYAFDAIAPILFPNKTMEGITKMSGRTKLWEWFLDAWKTQPWLGLGFAVGERCGSYFGFVYTLSTHNGFLSILVNTGIVGCFFWVFYFLELGFTIQRKLSISPYVNPIASSLVMIIVNNLSFPVLGSIYSAPSVVALLVLSYYSVWEFQTPASYSPQLFSENGINRA